MRKPIGSLNYIRVHGVQAIVNRLWKTCVCVCRALLGRDEIENLRKAKIDVLNVISMCTNYC